MITYLFRVIILLFLVCSLSAQESADFQAKLQPAFEYGPRPPQSVFDPNGYLDPELAKEISDQLDTHLKNDGIDVMVVVLPDLGNAPPEHVARSFASAWCEAVIHCVVLHVPGNEESPWIVPDGKMIEYLNTAYVERAVADARRRAASESKERDKVKAAATEASDLLRYWMANAVNRTEMIQFERARIRQELETRSRQQKIIMLASAALLFPLGGMIWVFTKILRRRRPGYFPTPHYQPRLGAPYAGGNRACIELGPLPRRS